MHVLRPNSTLGGTRGYVPGRSTAQENQALLYYIQVKENETVWTFVRELNPWWQRKEDTQIHFEEFQDKCNTAVQQYNIYSMMI